ncbi:MAG: PIG-L family deacetylase [Desulfobacterales bacterium]|nr:PIG-L family deacetylase [Desulfobacterales bacterium]
MKTILIVAAHPDDEVLGCGGLIARESRRGSLCHVLILTDGSSGRYDAEKAAAHGQNIEAANRVLGTASVRCEDFPNQRLETVPVTAIAQCIEAHLERIAPSAVYTHHSGDLNRDHRIACEATMVACRPYPSQTVREIYSYNVPSSTEYNAVSVDTVFVPSVFVDISDTLETKVEALLAYDTECHPFPHPRSPESLRGHARYWGLTVGMADAEPFRLIREIR